MPMDIGLQATIRALPHAPGVYLFRDAQGTIIYIGKAKDLRNRCTSYISPEAWDHKGQTLVATAAALEHIETVNEVTALVLEAELISVVGGGCAYVAHQHHRGAARQFGHVG